MTPKALEIFLDTSVIFAAVLSRIGGSRKLFHLGEAGVVHLVVGPTVLREADEVVRRKKPTSLPILAQLLDIGQVGTSPAAGESQLDLARSCVQYLPDAKVLAEAINAEPEWFVTHDKEHFLTMGCEERLPFIVGTPGDLLQTLKESYR